MIGEDVYPILSLQSCLDKRAAKGGVSPQQVAQAIAFAQGAVGVRTFICINLSLAYRWAFLWQKKADPGDPQKFTLALVIRAEKLSKRAVTSRVKRGAAPFL